jgi:hypothetical protein
MYVCVHVYVLVCMLRQFHQAVIRPAMVRTHARCIYNIISYTTLTRLYLMLARIVTQGAPIALGFIFACVFFINYRRRPANKRPRASVVIDDFLGLFMSTIVFAYFMVARSTLSVFNCYKQTGTGRMVLIADPTIVCYVAGSWQTVRVRLCMCV